MDQNNEGLRIAHARRMAPAPDTTEPRTPMAHPAESVRRRFAKMAAKIGLIATVAGGGAGGVHHVTGVDVAGPVGLGAAVDNIGSAAVDKLVQLANSEPQQEQENLDQEKAATKALFKPNYARVGGQIEIDLAGLSEARTEDILLAIRMGNEYEKIDVNNITGVNRLSAEPSSRFTIDSPTIADLTNQGLGIYYTASIETGKGMEPVLIPEGSVRLTIPGELKPLSTIEDTSVLDVAHKIFPTN